MHELRNYSTKTMKGFCLTCNGIRDIKTIRKEYLCVYDYAEIKSARTKAHKDRNAAREQAFRNKTQRLRTTYNLSWYEYLSMLDTQHYRCAICTDIFSKDNPPHVDHNHKCCPDKTSCGRCIRGLLCRLCNTAIGYLRDSPHAPLRAYAYLGGS